MSWLTEQFSFHPEPAPHIDPDNWEAAFRALGETRNLTFRYRVPGYPDSVDRELDPYHVVCYRGEWYVAGWCHYNEEVRLFAVSRMGGAAVSDKTFVVPANFDAQEYFGKTFGIIRSDEEYAVAIMFTSDQAPYIRERIWHEEQSIEDTSDGGLILRFPTVNCSRSNAGCSPGEKPPRFSSRRSWSGWSMGSCRGRYSTTEKEQATVAENLTHFSQGISTL